MSPQPGPPPLHHGRPPGQPGWPEVFHGGAGVRGGSLGVFGCADALENTYSLPVCGPPMFRRESLLFTTQFRVPRAQWTEGGWVGRSGRRGAMAGGVQARLSGGLTNGLSPRRQPAFPRLSPAGRLMQTSLGMPPRQKNDAVPLTSDTDLQAPNRRACM